MPLNTQSLDRILRTETTVSATITVNTAFTLPSAANMAGKLYTIYNPSASTANVLVNASNASLVVTVQPGTAAVVTPISDTPATNAAWMVVSNGVNASGVKGNVSGSAIAAGYVGETLVASRLHANRAGLTGDTAINIASLPLGPGVWDVYVNAGIDVGVTTLGYFFIGISKVSATQPSGTGTLSVPVNGEMKVQIDHIASDIYTASTLIYYGLGPVRNNLSTATTLYFVITAGWRAGQGNGFGSITAVRAG